MIGIKKLGPILYGWTRLTGVANVGQRNISPNSSVTTTPDTAKQTDT